jgi:hypothetical protein
MAVPALRTVITAAGSLALVSCILIVSPERFGDTCRFSGEETQCGACLVDHCRAELDECCRDDQCDPTLRAVEACATRHDASCSAIARDAARFPIARCAAQRCGGVCVALQGTPLTRCEEPTLAEGAACVCLYDESGGGNDFVCGTAAYAQTLCCAPKGWPAAGLECACLPIDCSPTREGCSCNRIKNAPEQSACAGAICCAETDSCTCGSRPCFAFETPVATCTLAAIACPKDQIRLESCSQRTP